MEQSLGSSGQIQTSISRLNTRFTSLRNTVCYDNYVFTVLQINFQVKLEFIILFLKIKLKSNQIFKVKICYYYFFCIIFLFNRLNKYFHYIGCNELPWFPLIYDNFTCEINSIISLLWRHITIGVFETKQIVNACSIEKDIVPYIFYFYFIKKLIVNVIKRITNKKIQVSKNI